MKKLAILGFVVVILFTSCKTQKCKGYKDVDDMIILQKLTPIYIIGIDSSEFEGLDYYDYFSIYNLKFKTIRKYNVIVCEMKRFNMKEIDVVPVGFDLNRYHKEHKDGFRVVDTLVYRK